MKKRSLRVWAVFILLAMIAVPCSAIPTQISYQGALKDSSGNAVSNHTLDAVFSIYSAADGGTLLWTESQSVDVNKGLYTVQLGSVNPIPSSIFDGSTRYLGIKVGKDDEMTPRLVMVSVPYAYRSGYADDIANGVITAAKIATGSVTSGAIADGAVTDAKIVSVSGSKVIGTILPGAHATSHRVGGTDFLSVEAGMIAAGAVSTDAIVNSSVTDAKIVSISGNKVIGTVLPGAHAATHSSAGSDPVTIEAGMISNNAVTSDKIVAGAITTAKISNEAVTTAKLSTTEVSAGSYGSTTTVGKFTVGVDGRITAAESVNITTVGVSTSVPRTGQTTSYADYDDGYYQKGEAVLVDNGNGTITDIKTGLMWIKYPMPAGADATYNWSTAITQCENLSFAGYSDWRLPNINELKRYWDISHGKYTFGLSEVWSSSTRNSNNLQAWYFSWGNMGQGSFDKTNATFVFPVRGGN